MFAFNERSCMLEYQAPWGGKRKKGNSKASITKFTMSENYTLKERGKTFDE